MTLQMYGIGWMLKLSYFTIKFSLYGLSKYRLSPPIFKPVVISYHESLIGILLGYFICIYESFLNLTEDNITYFIGFSFFES